MKKSKPRIILKGAIVITFAVTLFLLVYAATGSDSVTDSFNDETKIASKENLDLDVVVGQVKLAFSSVCEILSPNNGDVFEELDEIHFEGTFSASDPITWEWTSSIDGSLGVNITQLDTCDFSAGIHTITFSVTDGVGDIVNDSITITVNTSTSVKPVITSPEDEGVFVHGESVSFDSSDLVAGGTPPYTFSWSSNLDGSIGNSQTFNTSSLSIGDHTITLMITDFFGATGTANIVIHIPPDSFDWRDVSGQNWMTPVKLQACNDCQIFAIVGTTEAKYNIQENDPNLDIDISEQYLLNCSLAELYGAGVPTESCYPYKGAGGCFDSCPSTCDDGSPFQLWRMSVSGVSPVTRGNLQYNLIENGPLYVEMGFSGDSGRVDKDGCTIYECGFPNHAVVLVGYDNSSEYWIVKNSYGVTPGNLCSDGFESLDYATCLVSPFTSPGYVETVLSP